MLLDDEALLDSYDICEYGARHGLALNKQVFGGY